MRRDPAADFLRALAFENALRERIATTSKDFRWGTASFCNHLASIYDANVLHLDRPDEDLTAEALVQEAERLMAPRGFKHRKVIVPAEDLGRSLAPAFEELGWSVDRLVYMVHVRPPDRTTRADVDEVVAAVHVAARDEFNRREPYFNNDEGVLREMREFARMTYDATDKRGFVAYVDDTIASLCELYSDGVTAQIEDVMTLEEYRGRGLATSVVVRALHEAQAWGHDTIFLVAHDEDWPKQLYEKLGFEAVGRTYHFLLKPEKPGST